MYEHLARAIAHPATQIEHARDPVDEGPKADTLHPAADDNAPRTQRSRTVNIALMPVHLQSV